MRSRRQISPILALGIVLWIAGPAALGEERPAGGGASFHGVVVGPTGEPAPGVHVQAVRSRRGTGGYWSRQSIAAAFDGPMAAECVATTTTDVHGLWRLEGLEPTVLHGIKFVDPGHRVATARPWAFPLGDSAPPLRVQLEATIAWPARLVDHEGAPLAGNVSVGATWPLPPGAAWQYTGKRYGQLLTPGDDGHFTIHAPAGTLLSIGVSIPGAGTGRALTAKMPREASDADRAPLEIVFGSKFLRAVEGVVTDAQGKPVANARVVADTATRRRMETLESGRGYATTDAKGRYRIEHLPGERLMQLVVEKDEFVLLALPWDRPGPLTGTPLGADGSLRVDVTLTTGRSIRGRVVDEDGEPVEAAKVRFLKSERVWNGVVHGGATTDAEGRFVLSHLPLRDGYVVAETPTHVLASAWKGSGPHGHRIRAREGVDLEGVELVLGVGETLEGRIVDRAGEPVAQAVVRTYYTPAGGPNLGLKPRVVFTDSRGRFAFHGLPPIEYPYVSIDAHGFAKQESRLGRPTDGAVGVPTIVLPRAGSISGRVVNASGKPMPLTPVRRPESGDVALADANGHFKLDRLPPGRHHLILHGPGVPVGRAERVVDLEEGAHVEGIEIRLEGETLRGGRGVIAGIVVDEQGRAVAGEWVHVEGSQLVAPSASVRSDEEGRFRVENLVSGSYRVRAGPPRRRYPMTRTGTLDVRVIVSSVQSRVLEGVVRDPEGKLLPHGYVSVGSKGDSGGVFRSVVGVFMGRFRAAVPAVARTVTVQVLEPRDIHGHALNLIDAERQVRLAAGPVEIVLKQAATLRGVVRTPDGQPIPGLIFTATPQPPVRFDGLTPVAESDAKGLFAFCGLQPGTYLVRTQGTGTWEAPAPIKVQAPCDDVRFTVVRLASIAGRLLDAEGRPVVDVRVWAEAQPRVKGTTLRPPAGQRAHLFLDSRTDAQGRFLLEGASPRYPFDVHVSLPPRLAKVNFAPSAARVETDTSNLVLRLERGLTVQGQVVGADDRPAAQLAVRSMGPMGADGSYDERMSRQAQTDEGGHFVLGPLPDAAVVKLLVHPTPLQRREGMPWLPATLDGVVAGARDVHVKLKRGVEIRGSVVGASAEELRHVGILLQAVPDKGERYEFRFDGTSTSFTFFGLAAGAYVITPSGGGRDVQLPARTEVKAPADDVVLRRIHYVRLHGRLTGVPPEGWQARFYATEGRGTRAVTLKADGLFDLGRLQNRDGVLVISSPDKDRVVYMPLTPSVDPIAAKSIKALKITGRVVDLPGKLRRAHIVAKRGVVQFAGTIAEDGWFEIEGLPPGAYDVLITARRGQGRFVAPNPVRAGSSLVLVKWTE